MKIEVKENDESTIMAVRRSALKRFKKQAVELELPMTELHDQISKIPTSKLRDLIEK